MLRPGSLAPDLTLMDEGGNGFLKQLQRQSSLY